MAARKRNRGGHGRSMSARVWFSGRVGHRGLCIVHYSYMHVLLHAADEGQAEQRLRPLAEGRVRSCFLMTEPDVASSDPLNLETTAVLDGDEWVIDGRKSFATGAIAAAFGIVVARTGEPNLGARAYSLIVVPTETPGWNVVADPQLIGAHF